MKNLERLIGLGLLTTALVACGGGGGSSGAGTTAGTGGGGGSAPSTDDGTPRAEDPMAPAPAPQASSFEAVSYTHLTLPTKRIV